MNLNQPMGSSYGDWRPVLEKVLEQLVRDIRAYNRKEQEEQGENAYEHLLYRVKSTASMEENAGGRGSRLRPKRPSTISGMPSVCGSCAASSATSTGISG